MLNRSPRKALPDHLRRQLVAIPRQELLCRDVERLWASWMAEELSTPEASAVEAHREICASCRQLLMTLEAVRAPEAMPVPQGLRYRLSQISNVPLKVRVPLWLVDIRYAVAMSYAAASLVFLLVGDPARIAQEHLPTVKSSLVLAADRAEEKGEEVLGSWSEDLRRGIEDGQARARELGEGVHQNFDRMKSRLLKRDRGADSQGSSSPKT